jgi:cytochrome c peroxidase
VPLLSRDVRWQLQEEWRRIAGMGPLTATASVAAVSGTTHFKNGRQFAARLGLALFEGKARCVTCHAGFNFTDESFHNLGVGIDRKDPDLGRYSMTKDEANKGAFKTPTLRDVARRPPYMHDGSLNSLKEVVAFYNRGGQQNPWLSKAIQPLQLAAEEEADLVAFL